MREDRKYPCMECREPMEREDLIDIYDNYGIFYKAVCEGCHDEVESRIRSNNYGKYLSHEEIYGEES